MSKFDKYYYIRLFRHKHRQKDRRKQKRPIYKHRQCVDDTKKSWPRKKVKDQDIQDKEQQCVSGFQVKNSNTQHGKTILMNTETQQAII